MTRFPPIGAITGIYVLIAAGYLVCFWLASRIGGEEGAPVQAPARASFALLLPPQELIRDRRFQVIMGVTLVYNLWCFPFSTMVPVIGQRDFALTPALVGAMSACEGVPTQNSECRKNSRISWHSEF